MDTKVSFYCKSCKLDQDNEAEKKSNRYVEWFQSNCVRCKTKLIRQITDKQTDPYFRDSIKLKKQRMEMSKDLIQYGEVGFKTLYRKQWEEFEKQRENFEKSQLGQERRKLELYRKYRHDIDKRNIIKKIYDRT